MMLTLTIVSVLSSLALFFLLSYHRFNQSPADSYFSWLKSRMPVVAKKLRRERIEKIFHQWFTARYPVGQRWIFLGLAVSYGYLVSSGFLFAFIRVRLYGLALLLHVILGALFAVCLCLAVLLRSRFYVWREEDLVPANLKTKEGKRKLWQIVAFWIFVASGFVLVVTALLQMMPQFSLRTQLVVFDVHRSFALAIFLSGIAFLYFSLVDEGR